MRASQDGGGHGGALPAGTGPMFCAGAGRAGRPGHPRDVTGREHGPGRGVTHDELIGQRLHGNAGHISRWEDDQVADGREPVAGGQGLFQRSQPLPVEPLNGLLRLL